ncbi:RNA polymerase sigma-70 factor [Chitinophaga cymbidii]|uniref:DNA-directed RNA polymerase sigma-70 factor n=1 Tax=Chitinophaga cymbidii TaxID=1096750 RepID=A0A512RGZ6_9BACT|nr:DNA-directed RNA polymerase sigma-70 factor [Chitinophaga cymbidii]
MYKRYAVMLLKKAYEKTGEKETAREFVQEVFLELLERKDRLDIHTSFKAYIFTALRNRVLNYLHRLAIHHRYEVFQETRPPSADNDVESYLRHKELEHQMADAIQQLPEKCRQVFLLSRSEELSNKEIAERSGISVNTVEQHMRKALRLLRNGLQRTTALLPLLFVLLP